jgi:hypothetical protein
MSTLKHVQASQGNAAADQPESSFSFPTDLKGVATGTHAYVIFRLVKKKKGRVHVDGICDNVLNPKTKRRERIYLLNGADSIWQTELIELLKDKEYYKRNRRSLLFEDSICRIPTDDERALEFARITKPNVGKNRTGSGKYDFYEYDPVEEQKERLRKQMAKIELVVKAKEMPVEQMKKLASFLGISFIDELGQAKGDDGVRTELMIKADTSPDIFAKYIDSKEVEIAFMVKKAIIEAKIDLTAQSGNALWAGGKGFICKIPANRKSYEYLTELAMTNSEDGRAFKEQLETIIT